MNTQYPGIVMTAVAQRRGRGVWLLGGVLVAGGAIFMIVQSLIALKSGDTVSTTLVRGREVPNWSLGLIGLAAVPLMWWAWRRESGATVKNEGLVNIQPAQGGLYLVGNYGRAKGVSLPVADQTALRIALVLTSVRNYGLVKLYGLRLTSAHGTVLMDLQLMPKALDLSPLLAELARRRIAVELDPALDARHDHGAAPHAAPPSGPAPHSIATQQPASSWYPQ